LLLFGVDPFYHNLFACATIPAVVEINLIFLVFGIVLGAVIVYLLTQWILSKKKTPLQDDHSSAAKEAEELLKNNGFKIIERGLRATILTIVSGKSHVGESPADFLVEKEHKKFIVHLHGGSISSDPADPALRRKFIESNAVYRPDGLLLLDMVDQSIQEYSFEFPKSRLGMMEGFFRLVQVLFIMSVILGIIWLMVYLKLF